MILVENKMELHRNAEKRIRKKNGVTYLYVVGKNLEWSDFK